MPSQVIQWFPGHMAKTRRVMQESLGTVDMALEVLDARIPVSSRNPEIQKMLGRKPILSLLCKTALADPVQTAAWLRYYRERGVPCLALDSLSGDGFSALPGTMRALLKDKTDRYESKGMTGRRLRAMVVGIPNVGKSTLINRLCGSKKAKAENRPGVTTAKQWVSTSLGFDLLDMPGVLWHKFDDKRTGENLAITGAIKDDVLQTEEIAVILCGRMRELYPDLFMTRYKLTEDDLAAGDAYDLFLKVGQRRGLLMAGGVTDEVRTARLLLDEFRHAKIGRISLERPPVSQKETTTPETEVPHA